MLQKFKKKKSSKKSFLLLVLATFVLQVWGGQVDENTARQVASQTLSRSSEVQSADSTTQLRAKSVSQETLQLLYKSSSNSENANTAMRAKANASETVYFYVFGAENNEGFVIVAQDITIYPNPAKDEIFIKSDLQIGKVEFYSLTGALLLSENNFNEKISVSALPQGIYLLKVYTDKGVSVSKIVKE